MKNLLKELRENNIYISLHESDLKLKFDGTPSPKLVSKIKENKEGLISYLSQKTANQTVITKAPLSENGYPLSSSQMRLWILSQIEESSVAYNMYFKVILDKNFDIPLFEMAINAVIERHEILRTVFRINPENEVRQWILSLEGINVDFDYKDLSIHGNSHDLALNTVKEDYYIPFDLHNGPLIRTKFLKIEDEKYLFYFNMHHIISDGWSLGVIVNDTMEFYDALLEGRQSNLPELNIQYKDYATWQLTRLGTNVYETSKQYWLGKFSEDLPILDLPNSKPRSKVKTYNGRQLSTYFNKKDIQSIQGYSQRNEGTLFMFLIASLKVLFHRYTNQEDIIVGSPLAGREHFDLENQIGFYVNTLALRSSINRNMTFDQFYNNVKKVVLDAIDHQVYPFDELLGELNLKGDTSRSALFDVLIVLQNFTYSKKTQELEIADSTKVKDCGKTMAMFDLLFNFQEMKDFIKLDLTYNVDIYDYETITNLIKHYKKLIEKLIFESNLEIGGLDFLSESERNQLLVSFNKADIAYPQDQTIIDLFEEQVRENPHNLAVTFNDKSLSYIELDMLSNQLAKYLQINYKLNQELIGVKLERSEWLIVTLISILKVGCIYVPIDVSYPIARIEYMMNDSQCKFVIDNTFLEKFKEIKQKEFELTKPDICPKNLAYVMYTSGSTGNPKGVMIAHDSVVRLVKGANYYQFKKTDCLLATGSISFDATTFEFWGTLLNGAHLVLCSQNNLLDAKVLHHEMKKRDVNIMWFTSGWLNQLIEHNIEVFGELKTVISGGDVLSSEHIKKLRSNYKDLEIINGYGPTENTTFSLSYSIDKVPENIPIGKPISNSTVYILNANKNLQPIGVCGEIYLGGVGLSKGYLNNLELTAEKFVENIYKKEELIYKTGDMGRWLSDGNIEFMGRNDNQIKLRGYRIELGEIDNALLQQTSISNAVTLVKEQNDENIIVSYIVSKSIVNKQELRLSLKQLLPDYMIPVCIINLENIPLTPNKKIDRKKLLEIKVKEVVGSIYKPAQSEQEKALVFIWKEVLGLEKIGVIDDFFELGGNSLKLVKLVNSYHEKFNVRLNMKDLFGMRTIEKHAELIGVQAWLEIKKNEIDDKNEIITF